MMFGFLDNSFEFAKSSDVTFSIKVAANSTAVGAGFKPDDEIPTMSDSDDLFLKSLGTEKNKNELTFGATKEWTPACERKFKRLARDKAIGQISFKALVEFERLAAARRNLRNPRTGEEVVAEYQQKVLTTNLVNALSQYVEFQQHYGENRS